jgi:hypothetical protein
MRNLVVLSMGLIAILCTSCREVYTFEEACSLGCKVGRVGNYSTSNTNWSRNENAVTFDLGMFPGGTSMVIGTCSIPGADATGKTFLRLEDPAVPGDTIIVHGEARDCARAADSPNWGDRIWYIVPTLPRLTLKAGCVENEACSGEIYMYAVLDANGEAFDVLAAFEAIRDHGVPCGISEGGDGWFRAVAWREGHFQGIQRLRHSYNIGRDNILSFYDGFASSNVAFSSNWHLWIGRVTADLNYLAWLPWNGNLSPDLHPYPGDEFYVRLSQDDIGTPYGHLGGFQVCGNGSSPS